MALLSISSTSPFLNQTWWKLILIIKAGKIVLGYCTYSFVWYLCWVPNWHLFKDGILNIKYLKNKCLQYFCTKLIFWLYFLQDIKFYYNILCQYCKAKFWCGHSFSFLTQSHVTSFFTQKSQTKEEEPKMNFLQVELVVSSSLGCVCTYVLCRYIKIVGNRYDSVVSPLGWSLK